MEHGVEKRNIALIEKCVMSGEGIRSLLQGNNSTVMPPGNIFRPSRVY